MRKWRLLVLMTVPVLMLSTAAAQSKQNFAGHWSLVTAPGSGGGGGRGATGASGGSGGAVASIVSGAPVNCGTECTIVQDDRTLTISRPASRDGVKPPDVVLNLDGRESTITQSANSLATYKANAVWDGGKLVVTRSITGPLTVTQTLSVEDGKLTVVSAFSVGMDAPGTLTYMKKK